MRVVRQVLRVALYVLALIVAGMLLLGGVLLMLGSQIDGSNGASLPPAWAA
jgi:hypothetical protein